jgi:hypothetical protein
VTHKPINIVIPAKAGIHWFLKVKMDPAEACPRMLESGAETTKVAEA